MTKITLMAAIGSTYSRIRSRMERGARLAGAIAVVLIADPHQPAGSLRRGQLSTPLLLRPPPAPALALPLPDESFDAATIAFGLRNLADRARGLAEIRRVLRPGGRLFVLEFSQPRRGLRPFYLFYLRRLLPVLAGLVTGDRPAYVYLNKSIEAFPGREALRAEIAAAGFSDVTARPFTQDIVGPPEGTKG